MKMKNEYKDYPLSFFGQHDGKDQQDLETRLEKDTKLVEKWSKFGLLNGIPDENMKRAIALLFENQKIFLSNFSNQTTIVKPSGVAYELGIPTIKEKSKSKLYKEYFDATNIKIESLQPPLGLIFKMDFTYKEPVCKSLTDYINVIDKESDE